MSRCKRKKEFSVDEPTVNLTPLIDVVFVILIMFILIAPLMEIDRVELASASRERGEGAISVQEASPLALHVRQDNSIWYNKRKVKVEELAILLKQDRKKYPDMRLQLFQDKKGHFGTYQAVRNAAEEAGFDHLDIILKSG